MPILLNFSTVFLPGWRGYAKMMQVLRCSDAGQWNVQFRSRDVQILERECSTTFCKNKRLLKKNGYFSSDKPYLTKTRSLVFRGGKKHFSF